MQTERIPYLLKQYLDNSITKAELDELMSLMQDEGSVALIQATLEEHIGELPAASGYREADWEHLFHKITGDEENVAALRTVVRRFPIGRWSAVAAAMLLLVAGGWFFLHHSGRPVMAPAVAVAADIAPGRSRATLTLADGSTVDLDEAKDGVISRQGGSQVVKREGSQLAYQEKEGRDAVTYNVLATPRGGQYQLVLPDGSKVWLDAASSLRYPTVFAGRERVVELKGEAYFEIAQNAAMPFKVNVEKAGATMQVEVLGTHFNIMAYGDEPSMNTHLLEGTVRVHGGSMAKLLRPGQQATWNGRGQGTGAGAGTGEVLSVGPGDMEEAVAWKDGMFRFNESTIEQVMRQLSRWYDVEVVYVNAPPKDLFRGEMYRNVTISKMLKVLEASGVHFTVEGKKILVRS
jgi:transmembrane sensor